jgi:hypothetical protein
MIKADQLIYVTGAYLSGKGYYSEISPEVPDASCRPDLVAVKPRMKDVKLRFEKGGAPVGIIYGLLKNEWISTEEILRYTGFDRTFVTGVLSEANGNGWVKKRAGPNGSANWALDQYKIPVTECLMVMSAAERPSDALEALHELQGSYDKGYLVFPFPVDDGFLNKCSGQKTGVMVFDRKTASILIQLAAKRRKITKLKAYASVCESAVINHSIKTTGKPY